MITIKKVAGFVILLPVLILLSPLYLLPLMAWALSQFYGKEAIDKWIAEDRGW